MRYERSSDYTYSHAGATPAHTDNPCEALSESHKRGETKHRAHAACVCVQEREHNSHAEHKYKQTALDSRLRGYLVMW